MEDLYTLLLQSEKFRNWKPPAESDTTKPEDPAISTEKHFTVNEVSELWGVSTDLVRDVFQSEDGVLIIDRSGTRTKRSYSTMRIPESVLNRVYAKMSER